MEFLIANLAPIMFATLVLFLLLGFRWRSRWRPTDSVWSGGHRAGPAQPGAVPGPAAAVFGIISNDTLLAVPFFTLMGLVLERSGMAEDLLETIGQVFGPLRGGWRSRVVFVGAMLAATTAVVSASVISMGLISLPIMLRYGYDRRLASRVIVASGHAVADHSALAGADHPGRPAGALDRGHVPRGDGAGFVLAGLYIACVVVVSLVKPSAAPALPEEARRFREPNGSRGGGVRCWC